MGAKWSTAPMTEDQLICGEASARRRRTAATVKRKSASGDFVMAVVRSLLYGVQDGMVSRLRVETLKYRCWRYCRTNVASCSGKKSVLGLL